MANSNFRKRKYGGSTYSSSKRSRKTTGVYRRRTRGFLRTSGYYGRFRRMGGITAPERKYFDTTYTGQALAGTGSIFNGLNLVTLGNGANNMVGRKIVIRSIQAKFQLRMPDSQQATPAATIAGVPYRLSLILDTQCNGAYPVPTDIYQTNGINAPKNMANGKRFRILKEWIGAFNVDTLTVDASGTTTAYIRGDKIFYKHFYKKLNLEIEMAPEASPGTRDISEVKTNNLLMCGHSGDGTIEISGYFRIRFDDN